LELQAEWNRRQARKSLLEFIRFVWWKPAPLLIGRHTRAICEAITAAVDRFLAGESSCLDIACPFRHGKSDIVSRALPAFFLGRCAELHPDIIMSGYGADLVEGFSKDAKNIIRSEAYRKLFPAVAIAAGSDTAGSWRVEGSTGVVTAAGLGGAITGKGGHLIIVDDYCKSRAEAVSEAYRKKTWEAFQNDLMTRRAPVSIVIVLATPWHVDGIQNRIRKAEKEDSDFPRFQRIKFPARNGDGSFLFPERFSDAWYREQYATLGKLAAGLLDCEPTLEGGNRFDVTRIKYHDRAEEFPQARYVRAWDLASSSDERDKDDPDYTVGPLLTVTKENGVPHLWVKDLPYLRAEAPRRDALIQSTARADGPSIPQHVEAFGGYKDAYTTLKAILLGISVVRPSRLPGDKSAKLAPLEPLFDAGNVHLLRAPWNAIFVKHFAEFPDGTHDDVCDGVAIGYHELTVTRSGFL
jgi:phage terminase large subunit-like protein